MTVGMTGSYYGESVVAGANATAKSAGSAKRPKWNTKKAYTYLEDMNTAIQNYKKEAVSYYASQIKSKGEDILTVDELKKQIGELFSQYTLTDHEPKEVRAGKHYLYIDEKNLEKMAKDADYRAKVYGLMDAELSSGAGYTLKYSDGRNVTSHIVGSIFSLCEENRKYAGADGIPYRGSGMSDHPFSSSDSHVQVRSMSFLYDNIDPAKSAARDRKLNAARLEEKRLKKRKEAKKAAEEREEKRAEKKRERKKAEEKLKQDALNEAMEQLRAEGGKYQSAEDIYEINDKTDGDNIIDENEEKAQPDGEAIEESGKSDKKDDTEENLIREKDEIETEESKSSVTFPEGKRAAQISSAQTVADIKMVFTLLEKDLDDCESGLKQGMCDEAEVKKVKAMIKRAQKRQQEIMQMSRYQSEEEQNRLTINIMM